MTKRRNGLDQFLKGVLFPKFSYKLLELGLPRTGKLRESNIFKVREYAENLRSVRVKEIPNYSLKLLKSFVAIFAFSRFSCLVRLQMKASVRERSRKGPLKFPSSTVIIQPQNNLQKVCNN